MYCKYCGHQIDEDSTFCCHCGKNITVTENKKNNNSKIIVSHLKIDNTQKNDIICKIKSVLIVIWKVIRTIWWILIGIIVYTVMGFIMAPLIAMFNADFPETGISKRIENIWKKDITEDNNNETTISNNQNKSIR